MRNRLSSDDARRRLLETAEEHFGSQSYEATSVQAIANSAGLATGSFYRYFPSKQIILEELLRDLNAQLRQEIREALDGVGEDHRAAERETYKAFFRFFSQHPKLFAVQRQVEFVSPAIYREYFEELSRRYARGAKEAMIRGEIDSNFDPEFLGYVYIALGHFIGMRWVEWNGGGMIPDDIFDQLMSLLDKALQPLELPRNETV